MNLTPEQLELVENFAASLMSPSEIALLLELSLADRKYFVSSCKDNGSDSIYVALQKGRLKTKLELQNTIIKLAKNGSPAAEPIADKYLRDQTL